jgi:hypothetical protein
MNRRARLWLAALALAGPVGRIWAASSKAPELKGSLPIWAVLATLVGLAGILVLALKDAKRTHGD